MLLNVAYTITHVHYFVVEQDICDGSVADSLVTSDGLDPFSEDAKSFRRESDLNVHHVTDMTYQVFNRCVRLVSYLPLECALVINKLRLIIPKILIFKKKP